MSDTKMKMKSLFEGIIASIVAGALIAISGLILQAFGLNILLSFGVALIAILMLVILFFGAQRFYHTWIRILTKRLLERTLNINMQDADKASLSFRQEILERIERDKSSIKPDWDRKITEYPNQTACELLILEEFRKTKKAKILTIRGEKYFKGHKSLLLDVCLLKLKEERNFVLEILVLTPEAQHITDEFAGILDQDSSEEIKVKMRHVLASLKKLTSDYTNIQVRCFDELPNFKMLLFDEVMFMSIYNSPKNDDNAPMLRIHREATILYTGFERYFDNLWEHGIVP